MKLKRHDIRDAMKNKFVKIADSHKNVFTLEEVLYNVNEVVDELYWEHKRIKDQASSGKEEQKELDIVEVLNTAHAIERVIGSKQLIYALLCSMPADEGMRILSEILNDFELKLGIKGGNKNE